MSTSVIKVDLGSEPDEDGVIQSLEERGYGKRTTDHYRGGWRHLKGQENYSRNRLTSRYLRETPATTRPATYMAERRT
jgi:hypothetical protein